jgi:ketosteroid isomerase-like protein
MPNAPPPDRIRTLAKQLDDAVEQGDIQAVLSFFTDDCEIELPGLKLRGKMGLQKALAWLYQQLGAIRFQPITILVEGNVFFEEFVLKAIKGPDFAFDVQATEILIYEQHKVSKLRLYFDRLAVARALARGLLEKWIVKKMEHLSLRGVV